MNLKCTSDAASDVLGPPVAVRDQVETLANLEETAQAPMWSIILHNDHTTFPDFVVLMLRQAFAVSASAADQIMQTAHENGRATVMVTSRDLAESQLDRARAAISAARLGQHHFNRSGGCELTFSIVPDTAG